MAENKMIYFLYGYIYAQAEQIVKEFHPTLSDKQFREEVKCVQRILIHSLIDDRKREVDN
jgi:hypothetical protein